MRRLGVATARLALLLGAVSCGSSARRAPDDAAPEGDEGTNPPAGLDAAATKAPSPDARVDTGSPAANSPVDAPGAPPPDVRPPDGPDATKDAPRGVDAATDRSRDFGPFFVDGAAFRCQEGMAYPASCEIYCSCWFTVCAPMPRFACVFQDVPRCLDECSRFKNLGYSVYRVNDRPTNVHCGDSLPSNLVPAQDAGLPCR